MTKTRFAAVTILGGALLVSGCTDPARLGPGDASDPNQNQRQGAFFGAVLGAGVGAIASSDKAKGALVGAAAGAIAGGAIGGMLDRQAAELREELANDDITVVNTGESLIVSLPQDITFAVDSSDVRPDLQGELGKVANHLLKYPDSMVQVVGHTDNTGSAEYNRGLSLRRANSVADILQMGGVTYDRLEVMGEGDTLPVATNLTEEGRAQNRRVEIIVVPNAA